jgi:(1->4)-alpha-D-glucan 1-alpha-D-glucosylmutase
VLVSIDKWCIIMVKKTPVNVIAEAIEKETNTRRRPVSVYRLQFNRSFTFRDAAKLVPYLHKLGITDCYASPYFRARSGSLHGYDISDHNHLNPEIGSLKDYREFVQQLRKYGMGQVLDFVPNHMGIFDNPKFQDVLEDGPDSIYAQFFDIDWAPVKAELYRKVLLPILEDFYGDVLEKGLLRLSFQDGKFSISYRDHQLPIRLKTSLYVLEPALEKLGSVLGDGHPDFRELRDIAAACRGLPELSDTQTKRIEARHREREAIKQRLIKLCRKNKVVDAQIKETAVSFNGTAGDAASFARLHELLEKQAYRLSYWRAASEEINYRRFFDINELVALRMEDPSVFEETHRFVRRLLDSKTITGVRLDHVDGLYDPIEYLWRLQRSRWLDMARRQIARNPGLFSSSPTARDKKLTEWFDREYRANPDSTALRPLFIVVEKILGNKETLRETWPVAGTTGYDFLASLNQIFVNQRHRRIILDIYRSFTGINASFPDITHRCKNLVMMTTMSGEINLLAHELNQVSERSWQHRDFTLNSLRDALREVIACFPVYRTYINADQERIDNRDRDVIDAAILEAKKRNPAVSPAIFDFVKSALLLQYPAGMNEPGCREQRRFVMHFQQFTSPVTAKGVEDTAFYIYNPLVSLCEVGGYPARFGGSVAEFHRQNIRRHRTMPHSFLATSTHDTKRGEDVRARINVISEIPDKWRSALESWSRLNQNKKRRVDGNFVPDNNEEYLLYQTLLGTFPLAPMYDEARIAYIVKTKEYMLKAIREVKVHTSWTNPDNLYEDAVSGFITDILDPSTSGPFLRDFSVVNNLVADCGMYNSLSQVVLKVCSPGVPDIYQGNELWAYSLTDPDNRRPVDFTRRVNRLDKLINRGVNINQVKNLLADRENGDIKLYITCKSLTYRRENARLFSEGNYLPLKAEGTKKAHVCAFAWHLMGKQVIVVVPRFFVELTHRATILPLGDEAWGNSWLPLPKKLPAKKYHNILTAETIECTIDDNQPVVKLAEVFSTLPVAVLETIE